MSSSVGNNIPLLAPPEEMFGRTMRIPDSQLEEWWRLAAEQPVPDGDPLEAKLELARFIVRRSHGEEAARRAEEHFTRVVRQGEAPEEMPEVSVDAGHRAPAAAARRSSSARRRATGGASSTRVGSASTAGGSRATTFRPKSSTAQSSRPANAASCACVARPEAVAAAAPCYHGEAVSRETVWKVPQLDDWSALKDANGYDQHPLASRGLRRVEAFSCRRSRWRGL